MMPTKYIFFFLLFLFVRISEAQHSGDKAKEMLQALRNTLGKEEGKNITLEEVKAYFLEVALQEEFYKEQKQILRKWKGEIRYQVQGKASEELLEELQKIVEELAWLTGLSIKRVISAQNANLIIFFGKGKDYTLVEPAAKAYIASNRGLFFFRNNAQGAIKSATLYVETQDKKISLTAQKHLLREELTQVLGLPNDSPRYPKSIFYKPWSLSTQYAPIDRFLIALLYHPELSTGLSAEACAARIDQIFKNLSP